MLKTGGSTVVKLMKNIIDEVWKTGLWKEDWTVSELLPLPKIPGTQDCTKYKTIRLISHASKILLEILMERQQYHLGPQIVEDHRLLKNSWGLHQEKGLPM